MQFNPGRGLISVQEMSLVLKRELSMTDPAVDQDISC